MTQQIFRAVSKLLGFSAKSLFPCRYE